MTDGLDIPDQFGSAREASEHIEQLSQEMNDLKAALKRSEIDDQNLIEELDQDRDGSPMTQQQEVDTIIDTLNQLSNRLSEIKHTRSDRGGLDSSVADTVSDITGNDYSR
ncbi:hypothetical protein [Halostella salina]|uniref:hypothetical protein n=1 Tax=Halostella salina TaxID=1547897 RepID=UPI0013CE50C1|nr:hypothetical protein [Halostella salina]